MGQDDIRPRRVRTFGKEKGVAGRFSGDTKENTTESKATKDGMDIAVI
jgi:hypothetical protein